MDCGPDEIEIVICEDHSPRRKEIENVVETFRSSSSFVIRYHNNERNYGFDGNIRKLVSLADGEFVLFMGDDDLFIPGSLSRYIEYLKINREFGYILRSYVSVHESGKREVFRYLPKDTEFAVGEETVAWLFKRSVSLSGFTINRQLALKSSTSELDGTLLYQVYLMSEVCLFHKSRYCDFPVTQAWQTFRSDVQMFGSSAAEQSRFTPGKVSFDNSINFSKAYFEVAGYLDKKHGTSLSAKIRLQLSKYSYPFLSIQRKRGFRLFLQYANRLEKELGFGVTWYFYAYKWGLLIFGERVCDRIIISIKERLGYTPDL